jgi:type II secretory pathway pseudopilin PulG
MKRPERVASLAKSGQGRETAFTRLELIVVIAALGLIAGVVLPALAQSKPRSQQAICFNNLRMVGQAVLLFNAENGQMDPWRTPGAGYSPPSGLGNNAWFQFSWLSNGLTNPKVLACPSDVSARPAKDYSTSLDGGYLNPNYRNAAVSYFAGLDSSVLLPASVLAGDRNIQFQGFASCSSGINPAATIYLTPQASTSWLKGLHGPSGNILLHDGRVVDTTSQTVSREFRSVDDNGAVHLLMPSLLF